LTEFIQQILNGISLGSIYALIALGYTMVYGIVQLINFAHGEILMVGTFAAFFAITAYNANFVLAILIAMAASAVLGVIIERVAYKPLRGSSRLAVLITAIGASLLLQNGGLLVFGADFKAFPRLIQNHQFKFFGGDGYGNFLPAAHFCRDSGNGNFPPICGYEDQSRQGYASSILGQGCCEFNGH
jgi:branched-chain amino acid transport system permease protein